MLNAIGSSAFSGYKSTGSSAAGLQAQLDRYQKELSDCVNCDSAKTRDGKEAIQDISSKISEVRARIEEITATKSNTQSVTLNAKTPADIAANKDVLASGAQDNTSVATASASSSAAATIGNRLDVFA